jgi:hypothetical protein
MRWGRPVRRADGVRQVTVTLEVDTTAYLEAMGVAALTVELMRERADWRALVAVERGAARAYLDQVVREAWDRYGWDWPGPIRPTPTRPWQRMVLLRDVADPARPTLAELRDGVDLTSYLRLPGGGPR